MVEVVRAARPEAPLCLEMITRDPLKVPYLDDAYWVTYEKRDDAAHRGFPGGACSRRPPRSRCRRRAGMSYEAMVAAEDDNVRRSTAFARKTLHL